MSAQRVLIVDDDPALLQALPQTLRLRMSEVIVDTVDSALGALERISEREYDAVVAGIKMPGMDGLTLLAEILARRPDTPTVMITGHGEYDLALECLRRRAYDYIQKPIDRDRVVASLHEAIKAHALKRQMKDRSLALARCVTELERVALSLGRESPSPARGAP